MALHVGADQVDQQPAQLEVAAAVGAEIDEERLDGPRPERAVLKGVKRATYPTSRRSATSMAPWRFDVAGGCFATKTTQRQVKEAGVVRLGAMGEVEANSLRRVDGIGGAVRSKPDRRVTILHVNFAGVLDRVDAVLTAGGWRSAVVGGVALAACGHQRMTLDLDIVTESGAQDTLVSSLEAEGYVTLYRSSGFSNHRHPHREWGRVDFIYVHGETAERLFDGVRILSGPSGRPVRVPRPEHLIAMKVHAMKNAPERTWQEMADIGYLLTLTGTDRREAREYFVKANLLDRWDELARGL